MTHTQPRGPRDRLRHDWLRRPQAGFTLTEMLVVITIIGILASLITVAAMSTLDTGKQTVIKTEIDSLDSAMKAFKAKYGMFPPTDLVISPAAGSLGNPMLLSFIMQAFPRYQPLGQDTAGVYNLVRDWTILGLPVATANTAAAKTAVFRADQSLVFWLSGFGPDQTNPFCGAGPRVPFFDFDKSRLVNLTPTSVDANGNPQFGLAGYNPPTFVSNPNVTYANLASMPPNQQIGNFGYVPPRGNGTPYCYFDAGTGYGTITPPSSTGGYAFSVRRPYNFSVLNPNGINANGISPGIAAPYIQDLTYPLVAGQDPANTANSGLYQFCNPTSFQIISAGQDGMFGTASRTATNVRIYPTGYGYDQNGADNDNVTNFSDKVRLSDAIP